MNDVWTSAPGFRGAGRHAGCALPRGSRAVFGTWGNAHVLASPHSRVREGVARGANRSSAQPNIANSCVDPSDIGVIGKGAENCAEEFGDRAGMHVRRGSGSELGIRAGGIRREGRGPISWTHRAWILGRSHSGTQHFPSRDGSRRTRTCHSSGEARASHAIAGERIGRVSPPVLRAPVVLWTAVPAYRCRTGPSPRPGSLMRASAPRLRKRLGARAIWAFDSLGDCERVGGAWGHCTSAGRAGVQTRTA